MWAQRWTAERASSSVCLHEQRLVACTRADHEASTLPSKTPIIALSHLRWDFVYQRPQHVLSRLAKSHPLLFIEEPVTDGSPRTHWEFSTPEPDVLVCRPHTPRPEPGFHDRQLPYLKEMIGQLLERHGYGDDVVLWFYTPMALPAVEGLNPRAVIYDCMDELSAFWGAAPELSLREQELLSRADLVFTGGPSLYRAKKGKHPRVYCFPSSVDTKHFGAATRAQEPADQEHLRHPRLG